MIQLEHIVIRSALPQRNDGHQNKREVGAGAKQFPYHRVAHGNRLEVVCTYRQMWTMLFKIPKCEDESGFVPVKFVDFGLRQLFQLEYAILTAVLGSHEPSATEHERENIKSESHRHLRVVGMLRLASLFDILETVAKNSLHSLRNQASLTMSAVSSTF